MCCAGHPARIWREQHIERHACADLVQQVGVSV